jgi:hypothetical protein
MLRPQKYHLEQLESELNQTIPNKIKTRLESRLSDFRDRREQLIELVREGEMTLRFASARARELAEGLGSEIRNDLEGLIQNRSVLAKSLQNSVQIKQKAQSADEIQRQSLELLKANLVELQINNRKVQFESKTYVRNATNQLPTPSVDKLFELLAEATQARDDAAVEWSKRQLEQLQPYVVSENLKDRIDLACDRPDRINHRIVAKYKEQIQEHINNPEMLIALLDKAISVKDANACLAVYELVRGHSDQFSEEFQSQIAGRIERFSEVVLNYVSEFERQHRLLEIQKIEEFSSLSKLYLDQSSDLGAIEPVTEKEAELKRRRDALGDRGAITPMGLIPGQSLHHATEAQPNPDIDNEDKDSVSI